MEPYYGVIAALVLGGLMLALDKRSPSSYGITGAFLAFFAYPMSDEKGLWIYASTMIFIAATGILYLIALVVNNDDTQKVRLTPHFAAFATGCIAVMATQQNRITLLGAVLTFMAIAIAVLLVYVYRTERNRPAREAQREPVVYYDPAQAPYQGADTGAYDDTPTQAFYSQQDSLRGVVDQGYRPVDGHYSQYPDGPQTRAY